MSNLQNTQSQLENQTIRITKISKSIAFVIERLRIEPFDITNMVNDIQKEFKDLDDEVIITAFRNGSLGMYGQTYRLNTQMLCIWIRKYLEDNKRPINPQFG